MANPAGLISKAVQRLERPKPPSVQDLITGGPQAPPLTEQSRAGLSAQAQLAADSVEGWEAAEQARDKAAKARLAADDALWARINARRDRKVTI